MKFCIVLILAVIFHEVVVNTFPSEDDQNDSTNTGAHLRWRRKKKCVKRDEPCKGKDCCKGKCVLYGPGDARCSTSSCAEPNALNFTAPQCTHANRSCTVEEADKCCSKSCVSVDIGAEASVLLCEDKST